MLEVDVAWRAETRKLRHACEWVIEDFGDQASAEIQDLLVKVRRLEEQQEKDSMAIKKGAVVQEPADPPSTNGHSISAPMQLQDLMPRQVIYRRFEWVPLPGDNYSGFEIQTWVNFPGSVMTDFANGSGEAKMRALKSLFRAHNNWAVPVLEEIIEPVLDADGQQLHAEDGTPVTIRFSGEPLVDEAGHIVTAILPQPSDDAFWEQIPSELGGLIAQIVIERAGLRPNS